MASLKLAYGSVQNITITLASLPNLSARQSTYIDNSTNLFLDCNLQVAVQLSTGTPGSDKCVYVWFYGSSDGTNYTDNATGSDSSLTMRVPTNLKGPFIISTPDLGGLIYKATIGSVATFFGGILPIRWGIVIENRCGLALGATEGNFIKTYRGIYLQTV